MKLLLVFALFLSFANCPIMALALDDSHSVGLSKEHGVHHLIVFHALDSGKNAANDLFIAEEAEENGEIHDFHLSTSTGLVQKNLQISLLSKDVSPQNDYTIIPTRNVAPSAGAFENDIGALHRPVSVLRI